MALPAHRSTSSKRKRRASHFALKKINLASCAKCKQPRQQHSACQNCGTYSGRQVLKMDNPLEKKARGRKEEKAPAESKK